MPHRHRRLAPALVATLALLCAACGGTAPPGANSRTGSAGPATSSATSSATSPATSSASPPGESTQPPAPPEELRIRGRDPIPVGTRGPGLPVAVDGHLLYSTSGPDVVVIDTTTRHVVRRLPGAAADRLLVVGDELWSTRYDDHAITVRDLASGAVTDTIEARSAKGMTVAFGSVWVALHWEGAVVRIDPATHELVATVELHAPDQSGPNEVASDGTHVLVGSGRPMGLYRVDPVTDELVGTTQLRGIVDAAGQPIVDDGVVWLASGDLQSMARIETATGEANPIGTRGFVTGGVVVDDTLWVTTDLEDVGTLRAFDRATGREIAFASLPHGANVSVVVGDELWFRGPRAWSAISLDALRR